MNTVAEWIKHPTPRPWFHALDVLSHVLKGDEKQTAFKDPVPAAGRVHLDTLRAELERHKEHDKGFDEITERTNFRARRRKATWDESGDLETGAFIDKEERCFLDYPKVDTVQTNGITILIDGALPYQDRHDSYMLERHRKAYEIAIQAEADAVPCRVVFAESLQIPEIDQSMMIYLIIKDFNDPIFPGIWGALKNNTTTNDLINVISDYILGTRAWGNGTHVHGDVAQDFEAEDVIILDPVKFLNIDPKFQRR
jgi:hypothetical protein